MTDLIAQFNKLDKRGRERALDYLAYTHVSGERPSGMHLRTEWGGLVVLARDYDTEAGRWFIAPALAPEVSLRPFFQMFLKYAGLGFKVRKPKFKRNLLSKGIPMEHEDGRHIRLFHNGRVAQYYGVGAVFEYIPFLEGK